MFRTRPFNFDTEDDFSLMKSWLKERGLPTPSPAFLPRTGVVVSFYDQPICLGFTVMCSNGMLINTDFVADPRVPKSVRNDAVDVMREFFYKFGREHGYKILTVFTSIPKQVERLREKGFIEIDKDLVQLGRKL